MFYERKPIKLGINQHIIENDLIKDFIFGGKAIITVKNITTGNHFTFQINKCKDIIEKDNQKVRKELYFVSVCYSYDEWKYIGLLNEKHEFITSKKQDSEAISVRSFKYILKHYVYSNDYDSRLEFYHEGYCMKCGRILTEPDSIKLGVGPICRNIIKSKML